MAGDWIKMRSDLADDPAVIAVAGALGLDEFAVVGRLHTFWSWADEQSRDGHAVGVTSAWLDRKVRRDGFADALVSVGWLEFTSGGLHIPNFAHHNGKTAKTRALGTRRKQVQRGEDRPAGDPESVPPASAIRHAGSVTKARPEKRREESKRNTPPPPKGGADGFAEFWKAYPAINGRKAAQLQCLAKWKTRSCSAIVVRILAALEVQKESAKWQEESGRFVPSPLVWLNQERWMATEEAQAQAPKWWETAKGANAMAAELGLDKWDETIPFAEFINKVRAAKPIAAGVPA